MVERQIVRHTIAGAEGIASPRGGAFQHLHTAAVNILRRFSVHKVHIHAAQDGNPVTIYLIGLFHGHDIILVGMAAVKAYVHNVIENILKISAGMENSRLIVLVCQGYNLFDPGEYVLAIVGGRKKCRINMMRLLEMMIRDNIADTSTHSSPNERIARQVKSYIDANYHQAAALSHLENQFGYSKYYIEKLFRQAYQISVIKYQNKKRMEAAIVLLKECSVSQTAQKLGFSSKIPKSRKKS